MNEGDARVFAELFQDAYRKCFSAAFIAPLTESESHRFSTEIGEATGLEIGWKSLKNYSQFLAGSPGGKAENPSIPTLDTLARYVAGAPHTDDERRRHGKRDYRYWFDYKARFQKPDPSPQSRPATPIRARSSVGWVTAAVGIAVILALPVLAIPYGHHARLAFTDDFDDVEESALAARGWKVQSVNAAYWARRGTRPGHLALFTLSGDNWPQAGNAPGIRNLLVRRSPSDCFVAELRLTDFVPKQNWQQAGLLLLEDTVFAGKSLRLSIGYNDFSGWFPPTKEIIVQGVTSLGEQFSKPEEIAHHRLFLLEPGTQDLVARNLAASALRIEKRGSRFRLLYSAGPMKNAAFREVASTDFDLRPAYIGIFALKGFVDQVEDMPVYVDAFSIAPIPCGP